MSVERKDIPCACAGFRLSGDVKKSWTHLAGMVDLILPKLKGSPDRLPLLKAKNKVARQLEELDAYIGWYSSEISRIRQTDTCEE